MPIEFSRRSQTGARKDLLTAVIDLSCPTSVPTRVSVSALGAVALVRRELQTRENTSHSEWIGSVDRADEVLGDVDPQSRRRIHDWLLTTPHEAAVWAAIPPDFGGREFTLPVAIRHFCDLEPAKKQQARNYVARAPDEIDTPLRRALRDAGLLDGADPRPIDITYVWHD